MESHKFDNIRRYLKEGFTGRHAVNIRRHLLNEVNEIFFQEAFSTVPALSHLVAQWESHRK